MASEWHEVSVSEIADLSGRSAFKIGDYAPPAVLFSGRNIPIRLDIA